MVFGALLIDPILFNYATYLDTLQNSPAHHANGIVGPLFELLDKAQIKRFHSTVQMIQKNVLMDGLNIKEALMRSTFLLIL